MKANSGTKSPLSPLCQRGEADRTIKLSIGHALSGLARRPGLGVLIVLGMLAFGCAEPQPPQLPERVNRRLGEFENECIKAPQEAVNAAARRGATTEALAPARSEIEFMESAVREARAALLQGQQEVAVGWLSRAVGACDAVKAAIAKGL